MTIHDINEPKSREKSAPINFLNGVELVWINDTKGSSTNPSLAVGSSDQLLSMMICTTVQVQILEVKTNLIFFANMNMF